MKKKIAAILTVVCILLVMTQGVFAAGEFAVDSVFPEDGDTGLQLTNQMARIVFTAPVNENCFSKKYFSIREKGGDAVEYLVLAQSDDPNRVNIVVDGDLKESTEYEVVISAKVSDTEGNALGEKQVYTFKTKSQKTESLITTVLMFLMFGAIILFTVKDAKKTAGEEEKKRAETVKKKVNPYKEAKKGNAKKGSRK